MKSGRNLAKTGRELPPTFKTRHEQEIPTGVLKCGRKNFSGKWIRKTFAFIRQIREGRRGGRSTTPRNRWIAKTIQRRCREERRQFGDAETTKGEPAVEKKKKRWYGGGY